MVEGNANGGCLRSMLDREDKGKEETEEGKSESCTE